MIVAVTKYKESSEPRGVGIYKADLSNPSRIPFIRFGKYEDNNQDLYALPGLTSIDLSADGTTVALSESDNKIDIVTAADFSLSRSIELNGKVLAVTLDATDSIASFRLTVIATVLP